jgi:hypothetical protein
MIHERIQLKKLFRKRHEMAYSLRAFYITERSEGGYRMFTRRLFQIGIVSLGYELISKAADAHFDSIDLFEDLTSEDLSKEITDFIKTQGNDDNARLFI